MNFSLYLLGNPDGQYSQYPDDYTASTLAGLQEGMSGARLVIYREMDLVHYAYTERFGNNSIIGFCLIFNKARIQKPRQLIRLFRFIIEKWLVESGDVIKYTDDGELRFKVRSMNECIKEYDRLKGFLNSEFENNSSKYDIEPLKTTYNGVRSTGELDRNASDGQIVALTNHHNKVIVDDNNGIEHGYIPQVISSLREQYLNAYEEIARLQEVNANLERKKKQFSFVILLSIIIIGCGVGLLFLNGNLNSTIDKLEQANRTISNKNIKISELNSTIESKNREIEQEKERYSNLESEIASVAPFVITKVEIGSTNKGGSIETSFGSTLYQSRVSFISPKIYYKCFASGTYCLKTKLYNPDGELSRSITESPYGYTQSHDYYLSKGSNNEQMHGWGYESPGNYRSGTYQLEIWYNDKCVYIKSFTIY